MHLRSVFYHGVKSAMQNCLLIFFIKQPADDISIRVVVQ